MTAGSSVKHDNLGHQQQVIRVISCAHPPESKLRTDDSQPFCHLATQDFLLDMDQSCIVSCCSVVSLSGSLPQQRSPGSP